MGQLRCTRCGASTEAKSELEGRKRLDHSIGLTVRKPCEDGKSPLQFTPSKSDKVKNKTTSTASTTSETSTTTKSTKSTK